MAPLLQVLRCSYLPGAQSKEGRSRGGRKKAWALLGGCFSPHPSSGSTTRGTLPPALLISSLSVWGGKTPWWCFRPVFLRMNQCSSLYVGCFLSFSEGIVGWEEKFIQLGVSSAQIQIFTPCLPPPHPTQLPTTSLKDLLHIPHKRRCPGLDDGLAGKGLQRLDQVVERMEGS